MKKRKITYSKTKTLSAKFENDDSQSLQIKSSSPFQLSWSHYLQLIKIQNEDERNFYEIEAVNNSWSVREFERQYNSLLYERLVFES